MYNEKDATMSGVSKAISGAETVMDAASPLAALTGFYRAFNRRDLVLMESSWLQTERASMANPLGGLRRGWPEIRDVYRKIFNGPATVYVEFYDFSLDVTDTMFLAAGRERGCLRVADRSIELSIRTTRIFVRHDGGWKQLHHHGSMDDPGLLSSYRSVLLNT